MNFETLRAEHDGPIGRISLTRPKRLNALGVQMMRDLVAAARVRDRDVGTAGVRRDRKRIGRRGRKQLDLRLPAVGAVVARGENKVRTLVEAVVPDRRRTSRVAQTPTQFGIAELTQGATPFVVGVGEADGARAACGGDTQSYPNDSVF